MAIARMWDGSTWVDIAGSPTDMLTTDTDQLVTGQKTFQTDDGSNPVSIRARLTANGGQSGVLTEWRDVGGTSWTSVDATGKFTSLLGVEGGSLIAGNALGTQGILYLNKIGAATAGTPNQNSAIQRYRTALWNGSVSTDDDLTLVATRASTTAGDIDLVLANGRFKAPRVTTTDAAGTAALSTTRGQIINLDGVTANTLIAAESVAATAFTGSAVSDLVIKEPNGSSILLGTHGASGIQLPTLKVGSSDSTLNDNGTMRSLPRGIISNTTGPGIQTDYTTATTNVVNPTPPWVNGRTYLIIARVKGGSQITAAGNVLILMAAAAGAGNPQTLYDVTASPLGAKYNATAAYVWTCNATSTALAVTVSSSAGAVRLPASSVQLVVIDIGI